MYGKNLILISRFLVYIPKQTKQIQSLRIDMELIVEINNTNFNLDNLEKQIFFKASLVLDAKVKSISRLFFFFPIIGGT